MHPSRIRQPSVAGQFYPAEPERLKKLISGLQIKAGKRDDCLGCILPHAGYIYSGAVAVATVSAINLKDTVVLLGPNHTGIGMPFSIMTEGSWLTPFGRLEIDSSLAGLFLGKGALLNEDASAHLDEHSLEVQLPILQYFRPLFKIVPIVFMSDDLESLKRIGDDLAQVIKEQDRLGSVLFIASSDMSHYEPQEAAQKKDRMAIESILNLDEDSLYRRVKKFGISMCGYAPIVSLLRALKLLGAKKAELISYRTSAAVNHDNSSVVGYAGIVFK